MVCSLLTPDRGYLPRVAHSSKQDEYGNYLYLVSDRGVFLYSSRKGNKQDEYGSLLMPCI